MTQIDRLLKELQSKRRSKPVTPEQFNEWKQHPMTQIFFLDINIDHIETLLSGQRINPDHTYGRRKAFEHVINYEPFELTDYEDTDDG